MEKTRLKIISKCLGFVLPVIFFLVINIGPVRAQSCNISIEPREVSDLDDTITFTIYNNGLASDKTYYLTIMLVGTNHNIPFSISGSSTNVVLSKNDCRLCFDLILGQSRTRQVYVYDNIPNQYIPYNEYCSGSYVINEEEVCNISQSATCVDEAHPITFTVNGVSEHEAVSLRNSTTLRTLSGCGSVSTNGGTCTVNASSFSINSNEIRVFSVANPRVLCDRSLTVIRKDICNEDELQPVDLNTSSAKIRISSQECSLDDGSTGLKTALGCIPYETGGLVSWLLRYGISIGGGIAFLLMAWGAFLFATSNGDQERVKQGKEIITSAIAGLLFIIFSVFLLSLIGVNILKIPGFEGN